MLPVETFQIKKKYFNPLPNNANIECSTNFEDFMSLFMEAYIPLLTLAFILCIHFHVVRQRTKFFQSCLHHKKKV